MRRTAAWKSSTGAEAAVRPRAAFATAAVICALVAQPAAAQSRGERIESLEQRMDVVERQLENQGLIEMARQLEALDAEVRRLRGEIERLQHELETARGQQRDQYLDLDGRLRAAEEAVAAAQAAQPAAGPEAAYQTAFNLLKEGRYDEAAAGFQAFLGLYRDHELASNAQYWLGEVHYVKRDYPAALAAFEAVLAGYPGARKSADALLKAGYAQYELKRYDQARATLARVTRDFPESQAASDAASRLERMRAEGR